MSRRQDGLLKLDTLKWQMTTAFICLRCAVAVVIETRHLLYALWC